MPSSTSALLLGCMERARLARAHEGVNCAARKGMALSLARRLVNFQIHKQLPVHVLSARSICAPLSASTSRTTTESATIRAWAASSSCRPPTSTGPDRSYAGNAWAGSCASTIARRPEPRRSSFRTLRRTCARTHLVSRALSMQRPKIIHAAIVPGQVTLGWPGARGRGRLGEDFAQLQPFAERKLTPRLRSLVPFGPP
jgi:hypothetical protein